MPSLDVDVLASICAFLTRYADLLSLSLTSSVLHPIAVRAMLRNRPVVLEKVDTIVKFNDFIFADVAAARLHHLRALKIKFSDYWHRPDPQCTEHALEALLAIVQQATSLVSLELLSSPEGTQLGYLDNLNPKVVEELATVQEPKIDGRTEVVDFIGAVRAPLKKLALRFTGPVGGLEEWSAHSLSATLFHLAPSLEILTMAKTRVRLERSPSPPGSSDLVHGTFVGIQFHALRSLTINNLLGVPDLSLLLELFPNLDRTLHLTPYIYYRDRYDTSLRTAREQNGMAQERRTWKRLDRLVCDVKTLFVLNLRCSIGLTIVYQCAPDANPGTRQCLVESLRDNPPSRLNLQVEVQYDSAERSLGGMIPPEAAATLTHLTLCVKYRYDSRADLPPSGSHPRWADVWRDTLLPVLEHLHSLTHFRLVFHCETWWGHRDYEPHKAWTTEEDPLLEDLRPESKFDFPAVASAIAAALPSLRYCFLTNSAAVATSGLICSERWRESRGWRITHVPSCGHGTTRVDEAEAAADTLGVLYCSTRRELVELREDVAETIMEGEDLVVTKEEETAMDWEWWQDRET